MRETPQSLEEMRTSYLKVLSVCTVLLTFIAVTITLYYLRAILVPFTLSIFFYFMLSPTVDFLERDVRLPRSIAISFAIFGALMLTSFLALLLTSSAATLVENIDLYAHRLQLTLDGLNQRIQSADLAIDLGRFQEEFIGVSWLRLAQQFSSGFMGVVGTFGLMMIFTTFLLLGKAQPAEDNVFFRQVGERVSKYIAIKFVISLITGLCVWLVLKLIGIEFAMTFGLFAFILNFIPNVGSIIATLLPLPVAFLEYGFGWHFGLTLVIPGLIQASVGNIIEPRWLGLRLGLHPVVVLFFLFFWGIVWGLPGMFLSVPIMTTVKFVLEQMPSTHFLVDLLEGRINRFVSRIPQ